MGFFKPTLNGESENSKIRYKELASTSTYVNPININSGTTIDSSLSSFLKLKGNAATSAKKYLSISNQVDSVSGDGDDPKLKEQIEGLIEDLTVQQYIQFFFDAYMSPGGETDIKYRLGNAISKADISNAPYIGNNKNNRTYTPTNMELNFNISYDGFTGGKIKYFNNLFPPFNNNHFSAAEGSSYSAKSVDKWTWDSNGQAYVLNEGETLSDANYFDSSTLTSIRDLTYRSLSFKGVNDNISLLQKILEGATGIVSTYMTEWDISLYIQERIIDSSSIPCTTMNIKVDNPSNYYDKRAYCYGQLNAAVSKMSDTDVAINTFEWNPQDYPLSSYWTSYGNGKGQNGSDEILKVASYGLTTSGLKEHGFSQDTFDKLPFNEKVKFFDYQGAAYSGWTTFEGLKNYQLIYTTELENESAFDMLHLQTQKKEFGWVPNGKFDCICSSLEELHLADEDNPDYGEKAPFYEEDWEYRGKSVGNPKRYPGSKKFYKAYKIIDKDGVPTTAFGKMRYVDDNNNVLLEEFVLDSNGASISFTSFYSDTLLSLLNYGRDNDIKIKNGWDEFLRNTLITGENGETTPSWNAYWKAFWEKDEYGPLMEGIMNQFVDSFVGGATSYDSLFKGGAGWAGALFAIPKKKQFGLNRNSAPSTASYKQQSSATSTSSISNGENLKSAPQNGVSQLGPGLYGGPHGKYAHPNSIQGFFEYDSESLRNTPRATFEGFIDSDYNFSFTEEFDKYNHGVNKFYGSPGATRSPAACLKLLKSGFFEPTNYKVKVTGDFDIEVKYVAKTKKISKSEYDTLKAAHPGLEGVSKNYGKEYKIIYYEPESKTGGSLNNEIKFDSNSPEIAYSLSELSGCNTKPTPEGTGSYSSSTRPNSKSQCLEFAENGRPDDISSIEYDRYIKYATEKTYYVRSTSPASGVSGSYGNSSGYGGYGGGTSYELLKTTETPVGTGLVRDSKEVIYKEPLILSDFDNIWQISKVYTYDIVENSYWQSLWGNFTRLLSGKGIVKGNYSKGEKHVKYILRFKGNREDNSDYTEEVEDEDENTITRTKKWSKDLYCTDNELTFRKMIFGDNKDLWKHPIFFVSKDSTNPSLSSTVEIIQFPVKISEYDYIMTDVGSGSCGRKRVTNQKLKGEFIEVDLNYNIDDDWLSGNEPMKFAGLDASIEPFTLSGSDSYRSLTKDVSEITPSDDKIINGCLEVEDCAATDTSQTESSPIGPAMMAGLTNDDIEDIKAQAWYSGVGYTTYLPGLQPDISTINSDTIKKLVSMDELAPFTVDSTYTATLAYFKEALPNCKEYHIESPKIRKGFNKKIKYQLLKAAIEPKRNTLAYFEKAISVYEAKPILCYLDSNKYYFEENIVSALSSLKDLYIASDTSNKYVAGKTCFEMISAAINQINGKAVSITQDSLYKKTFDIIKRFYKIHILYKSDSLSSKKFNYISYDNARIEKDAFNITVSNTQAIIITYKQISETPYVDEIEEKAFLKDSFKILNNEEITQELKLYEYSYDIDFSHTPIDIYICVLQQNKFLYDNGEYEDSPQGIPSKRETLNDLYYSDSGCSECLFGTTKSKAEYESIAATFDGVSVASASEATAQIRKELARSAINQKFGDIFVDDFTQTRPKTIGGEGSYSFPCSGTASWSYQYAPFMICTPKEFKEIGAGDVSLSDCNFKPTDSDKGRILNKLFTQAYIAPAFCKEYNESPTAYIPTDALVAFNTLYKAASIQSNWIGIAKKFYVDLVNFNSAKLIIESGVGKDLLARTLPSLVGKDSLSDEDRDNVKYRYWVARAWDIFNSTKDKQGECFINAKAKLDALLKDRYGILAKSSSIKNVTPAELMKIYGWTRKMYEFLSDEDYQAMGNYMESYLNILYELRKYYVNKRCNKINGTLWNIRHIESSISLVEDVTKTDNSGIELLDDLTSGGIHSYNVVAKEVTNEAENVAEAIINKDELNKNLISHVFLKIEYVDYDDLKLNAFLKKINDPEFNITDLTSDDQIYVFFPHNSKFAKLPFTDTYTLTSGDYYSEKAKFLSNQAVKESFRKQAEDGTYTSDFKEFTWEINWKQTGFDTISNMLKDNDSGRYSSRADSIKAVLKDEFPSYAANIENIKIFFYDNSSDKMSEVMAGQTEPKDPIIVWGVADSINLKSLMGSAAALDNGTVDATSFYCNTGAKADYWRVKVPSSSGLPIYDDYNNNCMIEALTNVNQSIDYDETLTTILGPFAYSAYPINEQQENNVAFDIMNAFGLSKYKDCGE